MAKCSRCRRPADPYGRCRRRDCPGYRDLWAGDWSRVLLEALLELTDVALITVTAPGVEAGLTWDPDQCTHPPGDRCSGRKGCRVREDVAARWNQGMVDNWPRLHKLAAGRARRRTGRGSLVAAKDWERQERGVLHLHLVVPYGTPRERARADTYVAAVKERGAAYGFGYADLKRPAEGGHGGAAAAIYAGKYVAKATGEAMAAVRRPIYVGAFLTAISGTTMRALRWCRYLWRKLGVRLHGRELRFVIELVKAFPTIELVGPANLALPPPSLQS